LRKTTEKKTIFDWFNFVFNWYYLAGPYAQLTLLGQPKANLSSTQKPLPNENQNGRVPFRGVVGGQSNSMAERSNSTISTSSLHNTFDTKKAKDIHERIMKQLEVKFNSICLLFW